MQENVLIDMDDALYHGLKRYSNYADNLATSLIDDVACQRKTPYEISKNIWQKAWELTIGR